MNVLVTGGVGFIGAVLVERFVAGGHFVAVVDDGSSGGHQLHGIHGEAACRGVIGECVRHGEPAAALWCRAKSGQIREN